MSLLNRLFGSASAAAPLSRMQEPVSRQFSQGDHTTRRELLRVVLRDTLVRHGIPTAWLSAETLPSLVAGLEPGLHLRLLVKRWEPRLLSHALPFQNSLLHRVALFDPLAPQWLHGVSWQLALAADTPSPDMPDPKVWTSPASPADGSPAPSRADTLSRVPRTLQARDVALPAAGRQGAAAFEKTQPFRTTEPASL